MESGLLSLKWNNHVTTFFHVLETIRKKELYSDVTIACDGKYFAVHKLVLSTCSDYFFEIFDKTQCKHPIIVLKDINSSDFESLLNYMYVGEVNVLQNDLSSLIKAAECLRVKGLAIPDEPPSKKSNKRSTSGNEREVSHKRSKNSCGDNSASPQKTTTQTNVSKTPTVTQDIEEILLPEIKQEKVDPPDDVSLDNNIVKVEKFESSDGNEVDSSFSCMSQQTPNFMTQIEHNSNMPATSGYNESMNWPESENIDDDRPDDMANFDNTNFHSIQSGSQMDLLLPSTSATHVSTKPVNESNQFMKRDGLFWLCLYAGCEYKTCIKSNLVKHVRTHTGERPYRCSMCEYSAKESSHLYRHIRGVHPETCTK